MLSESLVHNHEPRTKALGNKHSNEVTDCILVHVPAGVHYSSYHSDIDSLYVCLSRLCSCVLCWFRPRESESPSARVQQTNRSGTVGSSIGRDGWSAPSPDDFSNSVYPMSTFCAAGSI